MWKLWRGTSQALCVPSGDSFCWCALLWTLATPTSTLTSPPTWGEMGIKFLNLEKDPQQLLHRHNKGLGYEDFIYVTAMKNFIAGVLTPVGGFMAIRLGARPVMALGCLIMAWDKYPLMRHKQTNEALTFLDDNIVQRSSFADDKTTFGLRFSAEIVSEVVSVQVTPSPSSRWTRCSPWWSSLLAVCTGWAFWQIRVFYL